MRITIFVALIMALLLQETKATLPLIGLQAIIPSASGMNFGKISPSAGSLCSMSNSDTVSGDCDSSASGIRTGKIRIRSLSANTDVQIQVTGTNSGIISFVSTTDISGAVSGPTTLSDGNLALVRTDGVATPIDLIIYGQLNVVSDFAPGRILTVNYTVDVIYP